MSYPGNGRMFRLLAAFVVVLGLAACATRPPDSDPEAVAAFEEANDPLEPFNRAMWDVNTFLDDYIARPITWFYRQIFPKPLRDIFTNVATNASTPITIVNALLQGNFERAGIATERLLVNSVLGVAGIADPASAWGIERVEEDLGQTLAVWGIGGEPYLVLPVIGPTNLRDAAGFAGDSLAEPVSLALDIADHRYPRIGWTAGGVIESRDRNWQQIDEVRKARDPYVFARSAFRQNRTFEINNGEPVQSEREEELFEQDFGEPRKNEDEEAALEIPARLELGTVPPRTPDTAEIMSRPSPDSNLPTPDFHLRANLENAPPRAPLPSGAGFDLR